jgi:outer membrane protein assembly factor BamB
VIPAQRLRITGPALVKVDSGAAGAAVVTIEDRGTGGHLDVGYDGQGFFGSPVVDTIGPGRYRVTLQVPDDLAAGLYRGTFTARICQEAPCQTPVAGTTARKSIRVHARWVNRGEWETFQRDSAHSGYAPVNIDARDITLAWVREGVSSINWGVVPSGVTSAAGAAFVRYAGEEFGSWILAALDARNGRERWRQEFVGPNLLNDPAASGGRVYVATTGHEWTFLWSFDANDGTPRFQSSFATQWHGVMAPTVVDGVAYTNGGYYGGGTYAYDADDGMPLWSAFSGDDDGSTPAVKDGRVYYYDSAALRIYDAFDGADLGTIADPNVDSPGGYTLNSAPMVGSEDHVVAFSGVWSMDRKLVNYSPTSGSTRWTSAKDYSTHPATHAGVIYAGANNPKSFDAIDEATGNILRSWVPGTSDISFDHNVVLTRNLAFVSTNRAVHAVDLETFRPVWSYPSPGVLSLSGDGMLYLIEHNQQRHVTGRIFAFRVH